ncbi:hypothetical protein GCM10022262_34150 [Georgenia daeguensis]|uniref:Uncharacterized protein n=1 Tax=Georgenia daeguensis TaxID=908355 RepID=A0ABP8EYI4_9MICO
MLLAVPSAHGVDYNAHVIESVLSNVAPAPSGLAVARSFTNRWSRWVRGAARVQH